MDGREGRGRGEGQRREGGKGERGGTKEGGREGGEGRDEGGREGRGRGEGQRRKEGKKAEECSNTYRVPASPIPFLPPSPLPPVLPPPYNVLINQFNSSLYRNKWNRLEISTRLPEPNVLQTVL